MQIRVLLVESLTAITLFSSDRNGSVMQSLRTEAQATQRAEAQAAQEALLAQQRKEREKQQKEAGNVKETQATSLGSSPCQLWKLAEITCADVVWCFPC